VIFESCEDQKLKDETNELVVTRGGICMGVDLEQGEGSG
jgi:hypothetical protein